MNPDDLLRAAAEALDAALAATRSGDARRALAYLKTARALLRAAATL